MGFWELIAESSEVAAVHAALLPVGEVVYYSGNTGPAVPAQVRIWNSATGEVRTPPNEPDTDLFCSGHALLPDGRFFVAGGTGRYSTGPDDPWGGSKSAYIFDPTAGWQRVEDMSYGRWYPSVICLPDGRMLVASGDDNGVTSAAIEIYDPTAGPAGGWQVLPESANRDLPLYPRLHVLPTGEVACAGQGASTAILNLQTNEWREVWPPLVAGGSGVDEGLAEPAGHRHGGGLGDGTGDWGGVIVGPHHHLPGSAGPRPDDLAVLLPPAHFGQVLNAGGGNPAGTDEARIISLLDPDAGWRTIAPMHFPRWFPNSAILPDGKLLVVGGGRFYNADPVMEAELFDPETETWTVDSTMQVARLYHSTALLMPDGRVWVAGTDGELRMEMYNPDYLTRGERPVLWAAPVSVAYGQGFPIPMAEPDLVASVCFIRLGSVTHAFNTEQRYVPLGFAVTSPDEIEVTAPPDTSVAPPGHYMLFIRNVAGVPAIAPIVQLVATGVEPPATQVPVAEEPVIEVTVEPVADAVEVIEEPAPAPPSTTAIVAALRETLQAETLDEMKMRIEALASEIEDRGMA